MSTTTLVYRRTLTIPEFKAETGSAKINLHQTGEGKLFFSTDVLQDDCKVSSKLSLLDIQTEPEKVRISEVVDTISGKEFFMLHFEKSDSMKETVFTM